MATKKKSTSFLKKGKDANNEVKQVKNEMEIRREQNNKPRRFWLNKNGEDARITFLDGDLDSDGLLKKVCFYEHHVKLGGNWGNFFVCPGEFEPCPICAEGEYKKEFVAVFTILDHRKYEGQDGKVYQHQRKLYVCKPSTLDQLQTIATKKGGLKGLTCDVTRTGDKKAKVGDIIVPDKKQNLKKVAAKLGDEEVLPLDYEDCFPSYTAKELEENFGFTINSVGSEMEVEDDFDDFDSDIEETKKSKKKSKPKSDPIEEEEEEEEEEEDVFEDEEDDEEDEDEIEF